MIVKVNWSGGKDSTCAVFKHLEAGHTVKAVCYVPMLNETIPLISKAHYDFIIRTKRKFEEMGATVFLVHGMTYYEYVTHIAKQGKFKGKIFGFPYLASGQCGFKRDSKLKALTEMDIGAYDYEDIGIAHDENRRKSQLNEKKRSILDEMGFTENDALFICAEHKILSPIYVTGKRDGCILCPNAKDAEIEQWITDYPEARNIVLGLQEIVKMARPDRDPPRRGYKWFI